MARWWEVMTTHSANPKFRSRLHCSLSCTVMCSWATEHILRNAPPLSHADIVDWSCESQEYDHILIYISQDTQYRMGKIVLESCADAQSTIDWPKCHESTGLLLALLIFPSLRILPVPLLASLRPHLLSPLKVRAHKDWIFCLSLAFFVTTTLNLWLLLPAIDILYHSHIIYYFPGFHTHVCSPHRTFPLDHNNEQFSISTSTVKCIVCAP